MWFEEELRKKGVVGELELAEVLHVVVKTDVIFEVQLKDGVVHSLRAPEAKQANEWMEKIQPSRDATGMAAASNGLAAAEPQAVSLPPLPKPKRKKDVQKLKKKRKQARQKKKAEAGELASSAPDDSDDGEEDDDWDDEEEDDDDW